MAPGTEWKEVQRKGLLSRAECEMLQDYPGGRVPMILSSWAMQTCRDALTKKCFWKMPPEDGQFSMHCAHIHNRLNYHVCSVIKSCHKIHYLLALPIPFQYFH